MKDDVSFMALYWKPSTKCRVKCLLCPHKCLLAKGQIGFCGVRENKSGVMHSLVDKRIASISLDPIEKKPLYHFYPSSNILSVGTLGCNFYCLFCQNYTLSRNEFSPDRLCRKITPEELCGIALKAKDNIGIAYTYNEPSIWYEFVYEASRCASESGLKNVLVTNGFLNQEPLKELLPYISAVNVDIKSMSPDFYKKYCKGKLRNVLDYCKTAVKYCHIEITNLIIPSLNDSKEDILKLSKWINKYLGKDTPLHLSAYRPEFKLDIPATPFETLYKARETALKYLSHVYIGNIFTEDGADTFCPSCKGLLIKRIGFKVKENNIKNSHCPFCGELVRGFYET